MRALLIIIAVFLLSGCISQQVDDRGNPVKPVELEKELVIDDSGRIIARPTHIYPPDRMIVNGDTPTEREIRLLGVEGLPEDEAPNTYAEAQEWMAKYLAPEDEIYIKPSLDSDLDSDTIYGMVYLRARDPDTGKEIAGGYVNVNMALLSKGLVRIRDVREFEGTDLRDRMQAAENMAKREKIGLWAKQP
ncbi:MAG: thermonuclease family protein [Planctomycetes bacterium]|nr:thermonuclease family protein [Planctomycetota bacterium]